MSGIGHNSGDTADSKTTKAGGLAVDQLVSLVERIEKLKEEKQAIQGDISDIFSEAKGCGFDVTALREMLKLRAMDKAARDEREALRDTYAHALGVFA